MDSPPTYPSSSPIPPTSIATPNLLTIPPELRELILKQVLQLDHTIRPRCPYTHLCKTNTAWARHRIIHCGDLDWLRYYRAGTTTADYEAYLANQQRLPSRPNPFWSLLLANKQIHAEATWMLTALNTIEFEYAAQLECFRRQHPIPIPTSYIDTRSPRPRRDFRRVQHVSLHVARWQGEWRYPLAFPWQKASAEQMARYLRPFKELRTLELVLWTQTACWDGTLKKLVVGLPRALHCRLDHIVGGKRMGLECVHGGKSICDNLVDPGYRPTAAHDGKLVVRVVANADETYDIAWMPGMLLSQLYALDDEEKD